MAKKTYWAGIIDGEIDVREVDTGWGGLQQVDGMANMPMLFANRKLARRQYEKVAKVEIRVVK